MKKIIAIVLSVLVVLSFSVIALGCGSASGSSSSSEKIGTKSKYDRDADYVASQFGVSSDEVKGSVDRLAGAIE